MKAKIVTTGGIAPCSACNLAGHDADSCRSYAMTDGRTSHGLCGSMVFPVGYEADAAFRMPFSLRSLAAVLLRQPKDDTPFLKLSNASFGPNGSSEQAAYAVAQGNEDVILNGGQLTFIGQKHSFAKLEIRFSADELTGVPADFTAVEPVAPSGDAARLISDLPRRQCPPELVDAITKLVSLGFAVLSTDSPGSGLMPRIVLHCGRTFKGNAAGYDVPQGILVEASYVLSL